jgi:hypothetical protein
MAWMARSVDPDPTNEGPQPPQSPSPPSSSPDAPSPPRDTSSDSWGSRKAFEVLALAFVFPATVYVGFAVGRWIGGQLGAPGPGSLVGLALGAAAAFWELYEYVRRLAPR